MRGRRFVAVGLLVLAACGEPAVDAPLPAREPGAVMVDDAGLLGAQVRARLERMPVDVVALTFESPDASLGHADRAGRALLEAWGADVALVAVARPGDFASTDEEARQRFFGVVAADVRAVSRTARERIADEIVPPLAAVNDWEAAFLAALDELDNDLS
jgi:hypothetical protein